MRLALVAASAGIAVVSLWPSLPPLRILAALVPLALLALGGPRTRWLGALACGLCWGIWFGARATSQWIPAAWEGADLDIVGVVSSLPRAGARAQRFEFAVERVEHCPEEGPKTGASCQAPGRVLLSWYGAERIAPGERWRFTVRLSRPHGNANPGAFDYEAWLLGRGLAATGYVRETDDNRRLEPPGLRAPVAQVRAWIRGRISDALNGEPLRGPLLALVIGESAQISRAQWSALTATGTNHLLIISGLHIGLVATLVYWLAARVTRSLVPGSRGMRAAPFAAIGFALAYSALAGFGLATQRAFLMVLFALLATLTERRIQISHRFCAALLAVTAMDPIATCNNGFWLSFGSVFFLLYLFAGRVAARPQEKPSPWRWLRAAAVAQCALFLGLTPLFCQRILQVALLSPLVNLVAVPWISFIVVPALFATLPALGLHSSLLGWGLLSCERLLEPLWGILTWAASMNWVWHPPDPALPATGLALAGAVLLLAPAGVPGRWLGILLFLPLLHPLPREMERDQVTVTLLDVGQGLAVVVETGRRVLLFDTGGHWSDRYDLGASVVLPYLRRRGVDHVDLLVVSHGEADHAGGAPAIVNGIPVRRIVSGAPDRLSALLPSRNVASCRAGDSWRWGEVEFLFLHPDGKAYAKPNDRSCVLRVSLRNAAGTIALLLPGDIERDVERRLIGRWRLKADVLVAPHHGSTTSSSGAFLNSVAPRWVLYSAGYRNRFDHPSAAVVARTEARGARTFSTALEGAMTIRLDGARGISLSSYRERERRYWFPAPR